MQIPFDPQLARQQLAQGRRAIPDRHILIHLERESPRRYPAKHEPPVRPRQHAPARLERKQSCLQADRDPRHGCQTVRADYPARHFAQGFLDQEQRNRVSLIQQPRLRCPAQSRHGIHAPHHDVTQTHAIRHEPARAVRRHKDRRAASRQAHHGAVHGRQSIRSHELTADPSRRLQPRQTQHCAARRNLDGRGTMKPLCRSTRVGLDRIKPRVDPLEPCPPIAAGDPIVNQTRKPGLLHPHPGTRHRLTVGELDPHLEIAGRQQRHHNLRHAPASHTATGNAHRPRIWVSQARLDPILAHGQIDRLNASVRPRANLVVIQVIDPHRHVRANRHTVRIDHRDAQPPQRFDQIELQHHLAQIRPCRTQEPLHHGRTREKRGLRHDLERLLDRPRIQYVLEPPAARARIG